MALKSIIVTVQGEDYELEYNEATGYYERTLSPLRDETSFHQPGGYFPVSITAEDTTGLSATVNSDEDPNLRLFVAEKHKPVIEIISPNPGGYIVETTKPEIQFKIVDNSRSGYSGVNKNSIVLKINGQAIIDVEFEDIEGGFLGKYTPATDLPDGEITITVDGADNDGNQAETASATFNIDSLAPQHNVTSPANAYTETSNSEILIEGNAGDTSTPITITIEVNGQLEERFEIESGTYSKVIDVAGYGRGEHTIDITATDKTGKSTKVTRVVKYNNKKPVFADVGIVLADGSQVSEDNKVPATGNYKIRCKVTTS